MGLGFLLGLVVGSLTVSVFIIIKMSAYSPAMTQNVGNNALGIQSGGSINIQGPFAKGGFVEAPECPEQIGSNSQPPALYKVSGFPLEMPKEDRDLVNAIDDSVPTTKKEILAASRDYDLFKLDAQVMKMLDERARAAKGPSHIVVQKSGFLISTRPAPDFISHKLLREGL